MPKQKYRIWAVGPTVGQGATNSIHLGIAGIAKKATPAQPYVVANELICNGIARALLLPCPPGALTDKGGETYFFSLDFNGSGQPLPPVNAKQVVAAVPKICWGVILFDALVMNGDRHSRNISYDTIKGELQIFDHSHALLGAGGDVDARLASVDGHLAIGGHCLAKEIETLTGRDEWISRVRSVPDFQIDGLVRSAIDVGLPADKADEVAGKLKARRDGIETLLTSNESCFLNLK